MKRETYDVLVSQFDSDPVKWYEVLKALLLEMVNHTHKSRRKNKNRRKNQSERLCLSYSKRVWHTQKRVLKQDYFGYDRPFE